MSRPVLLCLAIVVCAPMLSAQNPVVVPPNRSAAASSVIVLGTANPVISAARSGVSIGVVVRGTVYIFDAGPGVERRMQEATERQLLKADQVGAVFLTHLHADHTLGIPALLYHHLRGDLSVFGPPGTAEMMEHIRAAFPAETGRTVPAQVTESRVGEIYRDSNVTVSAFEVPHKVAFAVGYRVTTPDRVIVLSGDTRASDAVATACNGCDILFHEVVGGEGFVGGGGVPMGGHTSATELGEVARKAKPKLLVLYHQGYRGESDADLIGRISAAFKGRIVSARDLDVY